MESDIKEEISSRHPEYYFSSPQRIRRHIWYEGQNNWRCGSQSENHKRQCIQIEGATTTPILSIINNQIRKQVIILKKKSDQLNGRSLFTKKVYLKITWKS